MNGESANVKLNKINAAGQGCFKVSKGQTWHLAPEQNELRANFHVEVENGGTAIFPDILDIHGTSVTVYGMLFFLIKYIFIILLIQEKL